jgi:iron complex transport system permease protein
MWKRAPHERLPGRGGNDRMSGIADAPTAPTTERAAALPGLSRSGAPWLVAGVVTLGVCTLVGVLVGPVRVPPSAVLGWLADRLPLVHVSSGLDARDATIVGQLRLPRVVLGGLVGAMLAISGASYQAVFRNPLADPYLLGAAAGAGLGATIVVMGGAASAHSFVLPLAAFTGAIGGVALAYVLGRSALGGRTTTSLVLAGVAVASFLTAVQTYVQQRNTTTLRQVYSWILGRLVTTGWSDVLLILPYVVVATAILFGVRRLLDVISVGDVEAESLGLHTARLRAVVVVAASLGTAAAVAAAGLIGFVGLIVPHAVRLVAGPGYRRVIPLSFLFGASFMIVADLIARTIVAPAELPIGVITAFVGAPFFIVVLRRATDGRPS